MYTHYRGQQSCHVTALPHSAMTLRPGLWNAKCDKNTDSEIGVCRIDNRVH